MTAANETAAAKPASFGAPLARMPKLSELRRLLVSEFQGHLRRAMLVGLLGSLAGLAELFIVLGIAQLGTAMLDEGGLADPVEVYGLAVTSSQLAGAVLLAVAARGLVELVFYVLQGRTLLAYEVEARATILRLFIHAEWSVQSATPAPHFINTTFSFLGTARSTLRRVMDLVVALVSALLMIGGSFIVGGWWSLTIIVGGGLVSMLLRPLVRRSHAAGYEARLAADAYGDAMWETVLLAKETRVLGIEEVVDARNRAVSKRIAETNRRRDLWSGAATSLYGTALYGLVAMGLLGILWLDVADPARFVVILLLLYRGLGYGRTFQAMYQETANSEPAVKALAEARLRLQGAGLPSGGHGLVGSIDELEFRRVSFTYGGEEPALSEVNITIGAGDALGVVGPSGAGKSTFVHLLLRLLRPTEGEILVNRVDLNSVAYQSWFGRAVLVPQAARAYAGTVLDNVICGRGGVTERDARDALRAAHLLDEVEALPDGLQTAHLGERLSGGQLQRLALARALAGKPDVLVLDEPTSALDLVSEEAIRQSLEELRGRVTLVIVAHRLSTLRICDRVAVFDKGRLQAVGSREEMEAGSPFYAEAVRLARIV